MSDLVEIRPTKGLRQPYLAPVVEISDSYVGLTAYADIYYLSRMAHEELAISGVQLSVDPRRESLAALYRELKRMPGIQSVTARADTIANVMETLIKNQRVFIGLLVCFAGVIFFGSVLNSSLIGLAERAREVATLRVLGYTEWQAGNLFLRESALVNTLGTLVGLPLGYLLNWGITVAYDTEMFRSGRQSGAELSLDIAAWHGVRARGSRHRAARDLPHGLVGGDEDAGISSARSDRSEHGGRNSKSDAPPVEFTVRLIPVHCREKDTFFLRMTNDAIGPLTSLFS